MARRTRPRVVDIHPDDDAARLALRDQLIAARTTPGAYLTRVQLGGRLGIAKGSVQALEENPSWNVGTVQAWARGLGRRLVVDICGLPPLPRDGDLTADLYARMSPRDPAHVDGLARLVLCNDLIRLRRALGVTQEQLAMRTNGNPNTVSTWETRDTGDTSLPLVQRYARGLGGWLQLGLVSTAVTPASTKGTPS